MTKHHDALRILVVEDETLLALDLSTMLEQLGHWVVGPASRLGDGLRLADAEPLDAALLDWNLNGVDSTRIAQRLIERQVPFALISGYAAHHFPSRLRNQPLLHKPYTLEDLEKVLDGLQAGAG